MITKHRILLIVIMAFCIACQTKKEYKLNGSIERLDPALDNLVSADAKVEIIAEGFDWSEGPLWINNPPMLLFSDVPKNIVYKWTEDKGTETYLTPSGFTGTPARGGEMGSNGLLLDGDGKLLLCQHGDRRLARMTADIASPKPEFQTVGDKYDGKRFNSPNDAALYDGDYYLTDPPYGLEKNVDDPAKETPYQGVYRIAKDGSVTLLTDSLTRPNGIAFSPDHKYLFVANSDMPKARWYRYELAKDAAGKISLTNGKIFYDASSLTATDAGLPDGMKIDSKGNIYASGPGGVWIFNAEGTVLGKVRISGPASNTALSTDEKTLYITNDMYVLRVKMRD